MRGYASEVAIERQELASGDDRLSRDQAIDRRRGNAGEPAGVRNPCREHVVIPPGREDRKPFGRGLKALELIAGSNARQELLEDDAGDRQWNILPDESFEKGRDVGFPLGLLWPPERSGKYRGVEDDQRLLRSFL